MATGHGMTDSSGASAAWPRCGVSAAIFRGSQVLLIERGSGPLQGLWCLPGGHIEAGEPAKAAALREVEEETGVAAELAGLLDFHEVLRRDDDGRLSAHFVLLVFYGRWIAREPVPGTDAAAARFVPVDTLGALQLTEAAPELIHRALAKLGGRPQP